MATSAVGEQIGRVGVQIRQSWLLRALLIGGGYLVLALLFTWPLARYFPSAVLGTRVATEDHGLYVWHMWWLRHAIEHNTSPFLNPMVYHPDPVPFYIQALSIATGIMVAPFLWLGGPWVAYNAAALLSFVLGGVCTYALLRYLGVRPLLAFCAGLLYAFAPFHVTKYADGHLDLAQTQWLPLYLLMLLRVEARPSWRRVLGAALVLALIVLTNLYWALFSVLFTGLFFGLNLLRARTKLERKQALLAPLGIGALLLLVLLPYWVGVVSTLHLGGRPGLEESTRLYSADLLDFFTPNLNHPFWGAAALEWGGRWHPYSAGGNVGLGVVLLTSLAAATVVTLTDWFQRPRITGRGSGYRAPNAEARTLNLVRWLLLIAALLVLCLGPELKVAGRATGVPLPYALIEQVPGLNLARKPNHAVIYVLLCAVIVAALLAEQLLRRQWRWAQPMLVLALLVAALEMLPPRWQIFPRLPPSPFFAGLAAEGAQGALLNLPRDDHTSLYTRQQIQHTWPIVGGTISRKPFDWFSRYAPGARQLSRSSLDAPDILEPPVETIAATALDAYDVRYVVLHRARYADKPIEQAAVEGMLQSWLGPNALVYRDAQIDAYAVPRPDDAPPFVFLRDGWYGPENNSDHRWRWSEGHAEAVLVNPRSVPLPVVFTIEGEAPRDATPLTLALDGQPFTTLTMPRQRTTHTLRLLLPPGQHLLTLDAPPVLSDEPSPRPLGVAVTRLSIK